MRNTLLISLTVIFIVVGAAMGVNWYFQAASIQRGVEQFIAKLNAKQAYIAYDSITTSGFPSNVVVRIVNPRFSGRVDQMIEAMRTESGQSADVKPMPEWQGELALDGSIMVSVNALSDRFTLTIAGNWSNESVIGGETYNIASQSMGDTTCTLELARGAALTGTLWNYGSLLEDDAKRLLNDFRLFDCVVPAYTTVDQKGNSTLMSSGGGRIYVTNAPSPGGRQVRLFVKSSDSEVTTEGDRVFKAYMNALSPDAEFTTRFSPYGKQNLEIDLTYAGPEDWNAAGADLPLDIHLSTFDISNLAYDSRITFRAANSVTGNDRKASLSFKAVSVFHEQNDALLKDTVRSFIEGLYNNNNNPALADAKAYIENHSPEEIYAIISPAVPNFHSLGKTVQALDVSYQGAKDFSAGYLNLADLELSATPYGITGKGAGTRAAGKLFPTANMSFACNNCLRMIDDMVAYSGRVEKAIATFDPAKASVWNIDPAFADGIKKFLGALSGGDSNGAFTYTIVSDGAGNFTVNGKNTGEVMALYSQYMTPAAGKKVNQGDMLKGAPNPPVLVRPAPLPAPAR